MTGWRLGSKHQHRVTSRATSARNITFRPIFSRTFCASYRQYAQSDAQAASTALVRTRNIGIIAHIDAGKTTTTERMLYYSGFTRRLGDVDEGSTVTDFLPAERARGITIQSAAITFSWPPGSADNSPSGVPASQPRSSTAHTINLIDTPGHADFTFEVLRSLRVLDGAVCILDGVAGVEAQTETVWRQAGKYAIPRLIFVNKLDRDGAAFARTVREVGVKLAVWPAVCVMPWWTAEGKLKGVVDVVGLRGLKYAEGGDGKEIDVFGLHQLEAEDVKVAAEVKRARMALIELLSEHDDKMVEMYLEADEDYLAIPPAAIAESLRRCVLATPQAVVPVFAGASFRNIGVQPLLDAVDDLLPSPDERPDPEISLSEEVKCKLADLLSGKLASIDSSHKNKPGKGISSNKANLGLQNLEACALAFKVVADARRGILVYVRVYSGCLNRNAALWNTNLQVTERAQKLLKMYANDAVDVAAIPSGHIGVIPGLKAARTGDTLIAYTGVNPKTGPPAPINNLQLRPIDVPPPVFFVSVEPNSLAEERHIKESLDLLLREDPSLHMSVDEESGQTHLSGMGELHLEIARDRLVNDLKAKARIGNIEISYRETLTGPSEVISETLHREVAGKTLQAGCNVFVQPKDNLSPDSTHTFTLPDKNRLNISTPTLQVDGSPLLPDAAGLPASLPLPLVLASLQSGVSAALARGPSHNYPMHSTAVTIVFDPAFHIFPHTTPAALTSAARFATQKALRSSARAYPSALMEPIMLVTIGVDEGSMGAVVHDLSSARGGAVVSLTSRSSSDVATDPDQAQTKVDILRIYTPPDPFASTVNDPVQLSGTAGGVGGGPQQRQIIARVPLKEMVGYLRHLRSLTGGRGTFTMVVAGFEKMGAQRQKALSAGMRGEY